MTDHSTNRIEQKLDKMQVDLIQLNLNLAELRAINLRHDELSRDNSQKIEALERSNHEMQGAIRLGKFITLFMLSCVVGVIGWVVNREQNKDDYASMLKEQILDNRHSNELQNERIHDLAVKLDEIKREAR